MGKDCNEQNLFDLESADNLQGPVECLGMTFENDEKRREYFLEKLREKLKDPEFRKIEGFPIGEDEDILALSDPPYYTACPNPFIEDFIKCYGKPYNPANDDYRREPFAADVREGKNDPIYNAHAYHTKVSPLALKKYIEHFTEPDQIVLDFFAGTGMTGVAAQSAEKGMRRSVLLDLSPLATHVAGAFTSPFSLSSSATKAKDILGQAVKDCAWMYETQHVGWPGNERDPRKRVNSNIADASKGTINFVLWSDVFNCPECGAEITFWNQAIDFQNNRVTEDFACPDCTALVSKRQLSRAMQTKFDSSLNISINSVKKVPVLINYTYGKSRFEKEPDRQDFELLNQVEHMNLHDWHPTNEILKGDKTTEPVRLGLTHAHHFYTRRNLIALSRLKSLIGNDRALLFWFTATLPWCGKENRLHVGNYFGRKGGQITSLRGTWYIPSLSVETNVLERFRLRIGSALVPTLGSRDTCFTSTHSSTSMPEVPSESIDYIFVDPPFGHNLMYSELNCIWEAWLRVKTNNQNEAIINKTQRKDLLQYEKLMAKCFGEGYRTLKPGRWITVEFHNSRNSVWNALQQALERAGFVVADVRTLDKGKGSFNQVNAAGAVKRDLIISAYKPTGELENRFRKEAGTDEGVWDFLRTHLKQLPVFVLKDSQAEVVAERQNYLLFDRMVAFHVQRGVTVPLSAAEFYAGLEQRFPSRDGMYFLPDQAAEYDKKRMTVKEVLQLQLFVSDEASAIQWLKQQLTKKPQTFQDIHPQFMREIGGWQKYEKALELSELLEQNFLRYDGKGDVSSQIHSYLSSNFKELRNLEKDDPALKVKAKDRWYVPDPNKAGDLEKLRERALMREFEEYRDSKQKRLKVFRLEAVRAGFKKAWQERDYATIIAVARKIPEKILQEDPKLLMWYDQAITRMGE